MKYILSKEYEFEGQKYTEIELNLDVLTGKDVSAVKREWARAGNISPLVAVDTDFCVYLAAKAAKLPIEFMKGGALEWMQEPLIELASWNRTITKQLEAEAKANKRK